MRFFKNEQRQLVNIVEHTVKMFCENPNMRIYIGTDSQDQGHETKYATCICYRWEENKGAHYLYFKDKEPRIRDTYTRLYNEGLKTLEVYEILKELPIKVEALEFDYNNQKKYISNKLISTFKGWCEGLGQKALFKGGEMIATRAADHIVRGK